MFTTLTAPEKNSLRYDALTGVRALAAFLVFLHHNNHFPRSFFVHSLVNEFHTGVTIFFVLSGFLIAHRYMDLPGFHFRTYMVNRLARIYPVFFLLTVLTFWLKDGLSSNLVLLVLNLTFLKGFSEEFIRSGIWQAWSLSVEASFYLLAPVFFLLIRFRQHFLWFLPLIMVCLGLALVMLFSGLGPHGFFASFHFMLIYTFFGRSCEFFSGIGLAVLMKKGFSVNGKLSTYAGLAGICLCIFLISLFGNETESGIIHPAGIILNTLILPLIGIGPLFYGLIREKTIVSNILGSRPFVLLGKSSYVFYLLHAGTIQSLFPAFCPEHKLLSFILHFLLLNVLSILIFTLIEEPLNNFIRRLNAGFRK